MLWKFWSPIIIDCPTYSAELVPSSDFQAVQFAFLNCKDLSGKTIVTS